MLKRFSIFALVLVLALGATLPFAGAQDDLLFPVGEGDFSWGDLDAFNEMDFGGEEVRMDGPWETVDEESFNNVLAYFEQATNTDVTYIGSGGFEQQIVIDVQGGNPPNLAAFPQPGLAANIAEIGGLVPLSDDVRQAVLDNYAAGQSWVDLSTYADENGEDQFNAVFYNVNLKSIVWYVPDNFDDAGYDIPQTWDELIALSEQIIDEGGTPWCIGLGSGEATGWPGTDWIEDIMLRTAGVDLYDQWVSNELPFNSDEVIRAFELFGTIAGNDDMVNGGSQSVATTDFGVSPTGLFTVPPECFMHRQASFIAGFFPEDVTEDDADFFYFPPIDEDAGRPVLGGGTLVAITKDSPASQALVQFLTTALAHEIWMAQSGFLSPHTGANLDLYATDALRGQGEILVNADAFRFDGSDLMPAAIGAGAFWRGMVDFTSGASAQEVTDSVQSTWDDLE